MKGVEPLPSQKLYTGCDSGQFEFESTRELDELEEIVGQDRAIEAVKFGIGIRHQGYNLFALGPPGTGKHSTVLQFLRREAAGAEPAPDWCYVNNFEDANKPRALRLPAGQAVRLQKDMQELVEDIKIAIQAAFESDDYRNRQQAVERKFKEQQEKLFGEIKEKAEKKNISPIRTPAGMALAPVKDGEVLNPDEFNELPEEERERIQDDIKKLQEEVQQLVLQAPKWEREQREKLRELNREVTAFAVGHLIEEMRKKYSELPDVLDFFSKVEKDVIEKADQFRQRPPASAEAQVAAAVASQAAGAAPEESPAMRRYRVNVIVDNRDTDGIPVVIEDNPTLQNLVGRIEHMSQFGTLSTDFNLIKPGALHRANGGFLVIEARKLFMQSMAWEQLKRALFSREIRIESLGRMMGLLSTVTLEPQAIALDLKVILVGDRRLYYMLSSLDPDFAELFKVPVDFEERMQRSSQADLLFARLIGTLARKEELRPFAPGAVARVIERSSRLAGDSERLSVQMNSLMDLLRESDYWAREAGRELVAAEDVQHAVDSRIYRSDRLRERHQEEIERGTILIDTAGEEVGQVNGLSVIQLGGFAFGRPSRITARVRMGKGRVVDIEREVKLGGPFHSKGVLILSGFLGARFAREKPLSLAASLVFEQSYSGVDGDSASSAELYALLSALADTPIKQSLAVTGSVNQLGEIQAIGGVNEKVEGFFDVCKARGLTGEQGVLIPASNVKHLMLRADVVQAVSQGKFAVYPVETVDQGIELLTGVEAGARGPDGAFPQGSMNRGVEDQLTRLSERARAFGSGPKAEKSE